MYSTVPPWLRHRPSLIDALTGVPDRLFPTDSSEVVCGIVGVRYLFTDRYLSAHLTNHRVFVTAFNDKNITQFIAVVNFLVAYGAK